MFTLNIGLKRSDKYGGGTTVQDAVRMAVDHAFPRDNVHGQSPRFYGPHQSDTEKTIVAVISDRAWNLASERTVYRLAVILGQEAIAVYWDRANTGELVGPDADAWSPFNRDLFILPDGRRLGRSEMESSDR